ncbi:unnamed protein product [Schistocephalus solidus]|uniref:Transposase n=1 Tax=Schistocephalus solidus TaxID=70667 RepID=A0A183TSJ4_SCHSO|nr:unnamed protein product [Schistocephalus solidus]
MTNWMQALMHEYFITEPLPAHHSELPRLTHRNRPVPLYKNFETCLKAPLSSLLTEPAFFNDAAAFSIFNRLQADPEPES